MPLAALVLLIGCLAPASAPELQTKTYASPSGVWSLRVEPVTRDGGGEADYTLTGGGREAWKVRHPFALCVALVTDDGRVVGYADVAKRPDQPVGGSRHVVVLSPKGEVLLHEAHELERVGHHSPPYPHVLGQFVEPEIGRCVLRVADPDPVRAAESWWTYDLRTGKRLSQERPKLLLALDASFRGAFAVQPVPGTPLVLVHWHRQLLSNPGEPETNGAVFQLLDAQGRPVWRLDLPHDYEVQDEQARYALVHEMESDSAILGTGPQRFELRHVARGERVSYTVVAAPDEEWTVSEVGREPYREIETDAVALETYRPVLRSEVLLGAEALPKGPIRDILAFGFDAQSRIRFVREEEDGASLVLLSEAGDARRVTRVPEEVGAGEDVLWFALASPNWIAVSTKFEEGARARAWRVNDETGAYEELADFPGQDVTRVTELRGGRLLVLSESDSPTYALSATLSAWDGTGETSWTIEQGSFEDPAKLLSPEDVAVTTDGMVVVLDDALDTLQVFSDQGQYLQMIELSSVLERGPNDPSSIVADRDGGVLIHDSRGKTALWRMRLDGSVLARFDARVAGGSAHDDYYWRTQVAPDGSPWITDGHEFVGLDESGEAFIQLGEPAQVESLEAPSHAAAIDSGFGRILAVDDRTRAVHVFDGEGRRVLLCRRSEEDLASIGDVWHLRCDSNGGAVGSNVTFSRDYVRFAPDGTSSGSVSMGGSRVSFVPGRDAYWAVTAEQAPARFTATSGEVELSLEKRADGSWWRRIGGLAVASDGRLAVLDMPTGADDSGASGPRAGIVALFDAAGKSMGQLELPAGIQLHNIAYAGPWVLLDYWGRDVWLLDTRDGKLFEVELEVERKQLLHVGLDPSGAELWVLQPWLRKLSKFALPP